MSGERMDAAGRDEGGATVPPRPRRVEPQRIGYLTDDPSRDYAAGISTATSPDELRAFLRGWKNLAPDAIEAARHIRRDADWLEWRRGLELERKGKFAGEEWAARFAVILLPEPMLRASVLAEQFKVPWGTAWIRAKEVAR